MGLSRYLTNVYDVSHQSMWQSSLKYLTDMGDKSVCEGLTDEDGNRIGQFVIMNSNVTHVRGKARQGICLPIECSQEEITAASDAEVNFINYGISQLPVLGINVDILIFRTGLSQVYDKFVVSDVKDQELRDQTQTGAVITASVIGSIVFITIVANIYLKIKSIITSTGFMDEDKPLT